MGKLTPTVRVIIKEERIVKLTYALKLYFKPDLKIV